MTILSRIKRLITKLPSVGDAVWWAPKQLGCTITKVRKDGVITFQGGELVTNSKGRVLPRWTVMATSYDYDPAFNMYVVGQGLLPKNVRGTIIKPEPVLLSGKATGS